MRHFGEGGPKLAKGFFFFFFFTFYFPDSPQETLMVFFFSFFILKERKEHERGHNESKKALIYATNSTDSELLGLVTRWLIYEYLALLNLCAHLRMTELRFLFVCAWTVLLYDVISAENWFWIGLKIRECLRKHGVMGQHILQGLLKISIEVCMNAYECF